MYDYDWDTEHNFYRLKATYGKYVANELRPVFQEELALLGFNKYINFDTDTEFPLLWTRSNGYYYNGQKIADLKINLNEAKLELAFNETCFNKDYPPPYYRDIHFLPPVDIDKFVNSSLDLLSSLVLDTQKTIKEIYDRYGASHDLAYISFSGGKDSVVLLDICHKTLPLDIPVIFSDTDMELPDTYAVWDTIQERYAPRPFFKVQASRPALENWRLFGPPSQALRWCCSVHKSAPSILFLRNKYGKANPKTMAFVGVRSEESFKRNAYDIIGEGKKNKSQLNVMPLLNWSAHEIWLYIFLNSLIINNAYRYGLSRVGCILCPMSTPRQQLIVNKQYFERYNIFYKQLTKSISRNFVSDRDKNSFIIAGGWRARRSGVSLSDIIIEPEIIKNDNSITFIYQKDKSAKFRQWLKAIPGLNQAKIEYSQIDDNEKFTYLFSIEDNIKFLSGKLTLAIKKAIACVGCGECESECQFSAIHTYIDEPHNPISIDENLCRHCLRCYSAGDGCLRYYSKRYAGGKTMNIKGINKYMTFGLKPEWINILLKYESNFRKCNELGNRMIPSAVTWFREAGIIEETQNIQLTNLIKIIKKFGAGDIQIWHIIWQNLAQTSPLVKWFITKTPLNIPLSRNELMNTLAQQVSSESVCSGALASLVNLIKYSPLSREPVPVVAIKLKGASWESLERLSAHPDRLVILYSLFAIAEKTGRQNFTIREMLKADMDSSYISPIIAFGLDEDEFVKICRGLSVTWPDYLSCNFTLNLDEITVHTENRTTDNVIELILASRGGQNVV